MDIKFLQANNGDSILISYADQSGVKRNILIDGGTSDTYYDKRAKADGSLKKEILAVRNRNERIDLLILTHIDDDHIDGLLSWFEQDKQAINLVDEVWFNSGKIIAEYFKEKENKDLNPVLLQQDSFNTSIQQGIDFSNYLKEGNKLNPVSSPEN